MSIATIAVRGTDLDKPVVRGWYSSEIESIWPRVRSWLAEGLEHGSLMLVESLKERCEQKQAQLWTVELGGLEVAAFITEIEVHDLGKVLSVVTLGGERSAEWIMETERLLRVYAAAQDCRYLSLEGREGWGKLLRDYGWKKVSVRILKEL